MVTVWDAIAGILEECGMHRYSYQSKTNPPTNTYHFTTIRDRERIIALFTVYRYYKIYLHSEEEISIVRVNSGGESVAVDIDLRDSDCVEKIRKIILDET